MKLGEIELRVLGVLLEKAMTTPGSYPMTLNALVVGANQKQNRDPVTDHSEADVARALHSLILAGLVREAPPPHGARANRFVHNVVEKLHWDPREQALMAELILRGRQTAGELRAHASRMTAFPDMHGVHAILNGLMGGETPFVEELRREPGRSANRYRHLLGEGAEVVSPAALPSPSQEDTYHESVDRSSPADVEALLDRVSTLESQVEQLTGLIEELRKEVGGLDRFDPKEV